VTLDRAPVSSQGHGPCLAHCVQVAVYAVCDPGARAARRMKQDGVAQALSQLSDVLVLHADHTVS